VQIALQEQYIDIRTRDHLRSAVQLPLGAINLRTPDQVLPASLEAVFIIFRNALWAPIFLTPRRRGLCALPF
jgi:hypothetical protein